MVATSLINSLLFKPPPPKPYRFKKVIKLKTSRGHEIAAAYVKGKGPDANVTILFSHGNAEDLNTSHWWMEKLAKDCNVNVISYDYTGYGHCSEGSPSEENCYADIEAVFDYLVNVKKTNPEQIVLYGRSLGSGPSSYLAARTAESGRPVAGLILHSPFTSVYRVVFDFGVTMMGDKFPNVDRIPQIQCPVMIIHGDSDDVVPCDHGRALYDALPVHLRAEPLFVKGMGHNGFPFHIEVVMINKINAFLDYHVLARRLWMLPKHELKKKISANGKSTKQSIEAV